MNLFKKLLGRTADSTPPNTQSFDDLVEMLKPITKNATKIVVQPAAEPPANSQMRSHFGGQPYFETGEAWPLSRAGNPLQFVMQVFREDNMELPDHIKLVQFYYDFEADAFETNDDGWLVKIYGGLDHDRSVNLPKPEGVADAKYCEILFEDVKSLPDWEGVDLHHPAAADLSAVINDEEPWDAYERAVTKIIGKQESRSQLGGYPLWVQGEETPSTADGHLDLLFQITSEDNADVMWGDVGTIYVFYDNESKRTEFIFQCH